MSGIDHRAEAERKLAQVEDDSIAPLLEALVHATLAGPPVRTVEIVADETARRELDELRAAVLDLHQSSAADSRGVNRVTVGIRPYSRLIELAGVDS